MHAWSTSMLLLLHSAFMLSVVKLLLKGEVGVFALNSHGNYVVDHGKSWKNHGISVGTLLLSSYGDFFRIKFCSNGPGHMIKLEYMPIYGKKPFKKTSATKRPIPLSLVM